MALQGLFKRIFRRDSPLADDIEAAAPEPPKPHHDSTGLADLIGTEMHFLTQLEDTLLHHADVATGRVHLVGLEKIREHFGDDWPTVVDKVHEIAQSTIERRLMPGDFHVRYYDLNYMVVFASLSRDQALLKCNLIAQEIAERVLGRRNARSFVDLQVVEAKANGELRLQSAASLDDLASSLDVAFQHEAEHPEREPAWVSHEDIEASFDDLFEALVFLYRPVWNVEKDVISTYFCLPALVLPGGRILTGYNTLPADTPTSMLVRLDRTNLAQVESDLKRCKAAGADQLLATPVHFETLATQRDRREFIKLMRALDEELCERLVIEIVGLPRGAPSGRIIDVVSAVHPFCRAVLVRLPATFDNFQALRGVPLAAAGMDAAAANAEGELSEAEMAKLLRAFSDRAARVDLAAYVHGVDTSRLSLAAIAAGFQYVDGDTVASATEQPRGIQRFEFEDLNVDLPDQVRTRFKSLLDAATPT